MHYGSRRDSYCCALVMVAVCLFLSASAVYAQPEKTIVSAVSKEFPTGLNSKIVKAVVSRLDSEIDMKYVSFARKLVLMEQGRIDLCAGLHRNAEREKYIHFVDPPYLKFSGKYFFIRNNSSVKLETYDDLHGLRVATSINSKYFDKFDNDPQIVKTEVSKVEQKFKMLAKGRVDAVIHSYAGAVDIINRLGLQDEIVAADYRYLVSNAIYIGVSRRSHLMARLDEIEALVHDMVENGEFARIVDEHYFSIESALE